MGLSERSRSRLEGVHPDLISVTERAAELAPFIVTEGKRALARQKELVRKGASRTLNSRHLTGHAVDLADIAAKYPMGEMQKIAAAMKMAAAEKGVPIEWGGDWKGAWDTPHFQLPWKSYPAKGGGAPITSRIAEAAKVVGNARVVTGAGVGGAATVATVKPEAMPSLPVPEPPAAVTESITNFSGWKSLGDTLWTFKTWAFAEPLISVPVGLAFLLYWAGPWLLSRIRGA